jgi:hypothetical protein
MIAALTLLMSALKYNCIWAAHSMVVGVGALHHEVGVLRSGICAINSRTSCGLRHSLSRRKGDVSPYKALMLSKERTTVMKELEETAAQAAGGTAAAKNPQKYLETRLSRGWHCRGGHI